MDLGKSNEFRIEQEAAFKDSLILIIGVETTYGQTREATL